MHEFLKFIFGIKLLHVSVSSSVHHQEFFTVHTTMVYVIQVCWQLASFIPKINFEKFVHLVSFIVRKCHGARSPERQILRKYTIEVLNILRFLIFVHCICIVFIKQVRVDMRTAGVMPSEELISKPDSGEPCSFDISKAEREVELWCWAEGYHPQTEAADPGHAVHNCSNYAGSTKEVLPVNDTGTEPYNSDKQSFTWGLNRCETYRKFSESEELW